MLKVTFKGVGASKQEGERMKAGTMDSYVMMVHAKMVPITSRDESAKVSVIL